MTTEQVLKDCALSSGLAEVADEDVELEKLIGVNFQQLTLESCNSRPLFQEGIERLEEASKRLQEESKRHEAANKHLEEATERLQQETKRREEESKRREEASKLREEASKRREEATNSLQEETKRREEETKRLEKLIEGLDQATKRREKECKRLEEETKRREEETKRLEEETKRLEEETKRLEEETKRLEEETKRREEDTKRLEELTKRLDEETNRSHRFATVATLSTVLGWKRGAGGSKAISDELFKRVEQNFVKPHEFLMQDLELVSLGVFGKTVQESYSEWKEECAKFTREYGFVKQTTGPKRGDNNNPGNFQEVKQDATAKKYHENDLTKAFVEIAQNLIPIASFECKFSGEYGGPDITLSNFCSNGILVQDVEKLDLISWIMNEDAKFEGDLADFNNPHTLESSSSFAEVKKNFGLKADKSNVFSGKSGEALGQLLQRFAALEPSRTCSRGFCIDGKDFIAARILYKEDFLSFQGRSKIVEQWSKCENVGLVNMVVCVVPLEHKLAFYWVGRCFFQSGEVLAL
eukprot:TRINITY_DN5819_c0_g1_i1.p1 TRINITY_DN5819_c0_g1~~TRINITY_DN5819_c0_g1_i1.p1  ORF type:complete len:536 (-),score=133.60 TRINITY_DN5819_c0_g1_i1:113-1696(-)